MASIHVTMFFGVNNFRKYLSYEIQDFFSKTSEFSVDIEMQ